MRQRAGEGRMFIYDLHRAGGDLTFLCRTEMQRDMARIKVLRMLEEKRNLTLEWRFSVHAAAAASALQESTVNLQRHRKGLTFLSFVIFIWPLTCYSCHFISVFLGSIFCITSFWVFPDKTSQLYFSLSVILSVSISEAVSSAALFSLCPLLRCLFS